MLLQNASKSLAMRKWLDDARTCGPHGVMRRCVGVGRACLLKGDGGIKWGRQIAQMSEPGCCASFCGGIWAKIKEGKVKTSARMVAFVALVGMLACAIAVGLSSDCSVSPGIIGIVTSIFLIICEVCFCSVLPFALQLSLAR